MSYHFVANMMGKQIAMTYGTHERAKKNINAYDLQIFAPRHSL
jgi:hypothetical protein